MHASTRDTGSLRDAKDWQPFCRAVSWQESEGPIVPVKPSNVGGGKGPWFGTRFEQQRVRGSA
jgi:hypothetical protein